MNEGSKKLPLAQWVIERNADLRTFFRRRVRSDQDVTDLVQEVYLRLLRVKPEQQVDNPEAYLFTVARNLLREQAVLRQRALTSLDVDAPEVQAELLVTPESESDIDQQQRVRRLNEVLQQLPTKCQASVVLFYQRGLTYQQIGVELGISANMVKKYLAQALVHCRKRMASWR